MAILCDTIRPSSIIVYHVPLEYRHVQETAVFTYSFLFSCVLNEVYNKSPAKNQPPTNLDGVERSEEFIAKLIDLIFIMPKGPFWRLVFLPEPPKSIVRTLFSFFKCAKDF